MSADQVSRDPNECSVRLTFNAVPLDLAAALMEAIDRAAEREGYRAYFREKSGFETLYFSPFVARPDR